jgi:hypothetical protein
MKVTPVYAQKITLRNCGRFTIVKSDFGADYRTHTHVTAEALYASLTRGATWQPQPIIVKQDNYDFLRDYNVAALPLWFTPGIFEFTQNTTESPTDDLDTTFFNAVSEVYPTTSRRHTMDTDDTIKVGSRPRHVPTYGSWQAVQPDRWLTTYAFSPERERLEGFRENQTYLLGKKRTMFQIINLSDIAEGQWKSGECSTVWLQGAPDFGGLFRQFEISAVTMRYIILRGTTRDAVDYLDFDLLGGQLRLPDFYLEPLPINFKS